MRRAKQRAIFLAVAGLLGSAGLAALPRPAGVQTLKSGDLNVEVVSVQRAGRLIGDFIRSRDHNYLILKLQVRAAGGKTVPVHPRATFAVLSGTDPVVKYPVTLIGYFEPSSTRLLGSQEAIQVTGAGVTFSVAAEVPRAENRFQLAVQKPVAEAALGQPGSLGPPVPVKALEGGAWEGSVSRSGTQQNVYRIIPGSSGLDTLKPRHGTFMDLGIELKNAGNQPRAVTGADLLLVDATAGAQMAPLGTLPLAGRAMTAAPLKEARVTPPQATSEPLRPVWDVNRTENYTLRIYGAAETAALPAGQPVADVTVDTAEGHLLAGQEHQAVGRLQQALEEYQTVLKKFPGSDAEIEARGRIADVQVALIMGQPFTQLPQAQQAGRIADANVAKLEVKNDSIYTLTVYYSGPTSQILELKPGETQSVVISKGNYKVAARGSDPKVRPFAGEEMIAGGFLYQVVFFVVKGNG
jgi:hypothetical protein